MTSQHTFQRTDRSRLGIWWWTTDHILLGATVVLIALGVLLQFGTSPAAATRLNIKWPFHFAARQSVFAALSAALVLASSLLGPRGVRRTAFFTYGTAMLIMLALPFFGHIAKGAGRWVEFGGFTLQPSEFMKPALIVLVAWMFAESRKGEIPGVTIAFLLYLAAACLLLVEPDVGQTILITAAFAAVFWIAGVPTTWILGMGLLSVGGLAGAYFAFPHVSNRVQTFLHHDKAGGPTQVHAAAEAIAAGGMFGRGPGEGVMKVQIPDMHTDFAYSAAAEEYGLWFSVMLVALFGIVVIRGLYKAMRLTDPFEQMASAGLFVLVGMQAFINLAVNLALIPTKGMTLPFISYGGSSMLGMGLTMGMALALTRRRPGAYAGPEPTRASAFA
ncbi:MAG TPA: putative peptidoglycan glycosyltransferase FtsW [Caulobacteraceae bacterium]|nr:putative peptidoglycan glycosyltransferase FtsW [Caulobacteraceae bacterium]